MSEAKEEGVHPGHVTFIGSVLRGTYGSGGIAEVPVNAWKIKNQDWKDKRSSGLVLSSWDSGSCGSRVQEAIGHQRVERRGTSVGCGRSRGRRRDDGTVVARRAVQTVVRTPRSSWDERVRRSSLRFVTGLGRRRQRGGAVFVGRVVREGVFGCGCHRFGSRVKKRAVGVQVGAVFAGRAVRAVIRTSRSSWDERGAKRFQGRDLVWTS